MMELCFSGVVRADWTRDDAIKECFDRFEMAKSTVQSNKPSAYMAGPALNGAPGLGTGGGSGSGSGTDKDAAGGMLSLYTI